MPKTPRPSRRPALRLATGLVLLMAGALLGCTGIMHGTIVGTAGEPLADAPVRLACADRVYETRTDAEGRYRLATPETGACNLQVLTPAPDPELTAAATAPVYAFPHRTEYNFTLQPTPAGPTLAPEARDRY
ncbi:MAG: carboxypeptidase-like regulatory domain-containing protein [Pseudomonadota bacterium]|nr:carboxypeptidase-like regulatory domain-containing protein [Pseudomonadota bacterium]HJO36133.1 carboxypeptidase-like regulatory domain-containing protein [Gammaproteobacteria bacterium]